MYIKNPHVLSIRHVPALPSLERPIFGTIKPIKVLYYSIIFIIYVYIIIIFRYSDRGIWSHGARAEVGHCTDRAKSNAGGMLGVLP